MTWQVHVFMECVNCMFAMRVRNFHVNQTSPQDFICPNCRENQWMISLTKEPEE